MSEKKERVYSLCAHCKEEIYRSHEGHGPFFCYKCKEYNHDEDEDVLFVTMDEWDKLI